MIDELIVDEEWLYKNLSYVSTIHTNIILLKYLLECEIFFTNRRM